VLTRWAIYDTIKATKSLWRCNKGVIKMGILAIFLILAGLFLVPTGWGIIMIIIGIIPLKE